MIKRLAILVAAGLTLGFAATASFAQAPEGVFVRAQQPNQYLAADLLLKAKVHGEDGKIFGDVEDLIMNENNQIIGVIIGVGGFLGVGEKRIGVRYSALQFDEKDGQTVVSLPGATKSVIKAVPEYKRARPPKSFLQGVTERAKELAAKTTETTKEAYAKAKEKVGPTLDKARESAGQALEKAKEATQQAIDKARDAAQPKAN